MYRYFVSYTYYLTNGVSGTGNGFAELGTKIRGVNEIQYIESLFYSQLKTLYPNLKGLPVVMWYTELDS